MKLDLFVEPHPGHGHDAAIIEPLLAVVGATLGTESKCLSVELGIVRPDVYSFFSCRAANCMDPGLKSCGGNRMYAKSQVSYIYMVPVEPMYF